MASDDVAAIIQAPINVDSDDWPRIVIDQDANPIESAALKKRPRLIKRGKPVILFPSADGLPPVAGHFRGLARASILVRPSAPLREGAGNLCQHLKIRADLRPCFCRHATTYRLCRTDTIPLLSLHRRPPPACHRGRASFCHALGVPWWADSHASTAWRGHAVTLGETLTGAGNEPSPTRRQA